MIAIIIIMSREEEQIGFSGKSHFRRLVSDGIITRICLFWADARDYGNVLTLPSPTPPLIRPTGAGIKPHDVYAPVRPSLVPIMLFKRTVAAPYSNRGVRSTTRETTRGRYKVRGNISIRERWARPCTVVTSIRNPYQWYTTAAREIRKMPRLSGNVFSKFKSRHSVREHV